MEQWLVSTICSQIYYWVTSLWALIANSRVTKVTDWWDPSPDFAYQLLCGLAFRLTANVRII